MTVTSWGSRVRGCACVCSCDHAGVGGPTAQAPWTPAPHAGPRPPHLSLPASLAAATDALSPQGALLMLSSFGRVWLSAALWNVARQAPPSTGILQAGILEWAPMPSSRASS